MLKNLRETMKNAPIVRRGTYNYFIHPISDGVPLVRPELLREVIACMVKNANLDVDKIVTIEGEAGAIERGHRLHGEERQPGRG